MELWDLYTEDRTKTGETHIRGTPMPKKRYHLVVNVWIKNSEGKYLISKRARTRLTNPLKFEPVCGAVLKDEDSLNAAIRETKEEIGVDLDPAKGNLICTDLGKKLNGNAVNVIMDLWLFKYDGEVDLKNATTDEVESVNWMTEDEIYKLCESDMMVSHIAKYTDKVFSFNI